VTRSGGRIPLAGRSLSLVTVMDARSAQIVD
jgi:hypothetical protein